MRPWTNQEFALASLRRAALLAHDLEVAEGVLEEDIVQAADIEGWNGDVFMLANNGRWFYLFVLAVHWPDKTLKKVRGYVLSFERRKFFERQRCVTCWLQGIDLFGQHVDVLPQSLGISTM